MRELHIIRNDLLKLKAVLLPIAATPLRVLKDYSVMVPVSGELALA